MKSSSRVYLRLFLLTMMSQQIFADGGFDYGALGMMGMMSNLQAMQNMSVMDAVRCGALGGVVTTVSDVAKKQLSSVIGSSINGGQSVLYSWYKSVMTKLHGAQRFEVKELFGWMWILDRSIETHIKKVAKGARVVRAHVLEQEKKEKEEDKKDKLYGVTALKKDVEYIANDLKQRIKYYDIDHSKRGSRNVIGTVLDYTALCGLGYLGIDWLISPMSKERAAVLAKQKWATIAQLDKEIMKGEADSASIFSTLGKEVKFEREAFAAQKEIELDGARYYDSLRKRVDLTSKQAVVKWAMRGVITLFALYRAVSWMKSQEATALADSLSDVNREMIVHLTATLIEYLERLSKLCDEISEEKDIARLKDEFEFIGKNCENTFIHIARIIDQKDALELQRLGKPGQAVANFGQGAGGLGGGLPRL